MKTHTLFGAHNGLKDIPPMHLRGTLYDDVITQPIRRHTLSPCKGHWLHTTLTTLALFTRIRNPLPKESIHELKIWRENKAVLLEM